ncbi:MAG: M14 family murein peptide amidase A [Proteobacteria bacterium]|nr:M14 family murein peptide amidase A [Pseudomonadota bacterium]
MHTARLIPATLAACLALLLAACSERSPPTAPTAPPPQAAPGPSASSSALATEAECQALVRRLPNLRMPLCMQAQLRDSGERSVKGLPLYTRDLQPESSKLRVLVLGAIHGDELSSASVAFHWIALARDPVITTPQPIHWRFVPVLNPDGLFHQPPRRMNANGVDLNRNFPTPNWERDAAIYWNERVRKDPRRWPGPKAMSEPETKFVHAQMVDFKPDLIVSIHAPYGVLDFDGPSVPPSKLGRLYLDQVGIFPGSLGNYGGVHKGVPVVTVELPNAMRTPLDSETRQMWVDLLRWMSERLGPSVR